MGAQRHDSHFESYWSDLGFDAKPRVSATDVSNANRDHRRLGAKEREAYKKFIQQAVLSSTAIKKLVQAEWNSAAVAELLSNPEIQNLVQAKAFMENPKIQKFFKENAERAASEALLKQDVIQTEVISN